MATQWFCKIMGDEQGPMTAGQLRAIARRGGLGIDDFVRKHGQSSWVRAENVIGLFDQPSLPVVVKESIAVIDDFAPVVATWQATAAMSEAAGQRCSIEVQSQSRSGGSWVTSHATSNGSNSDQVTRPSSVVVPRRTLKVAAGARAKAIAERLANQTTQAGGFNPLSDTVPTTIGNRPVEVAASQEVSAEYEVLAKQCV
jgi:hypothetical protein